LKKKCSRSIFDAFLGQTNQAKVWELGDRMTRKWQRH